MDIAQKKKAEILERAVINSSVGQLSKIYDELGCVELSASALGLACRYRGLEMVKVLVEKGASFDFLSTEEIKEKYHHYIGRQKYSNYSLYLLKVFRGGLKGACCLRDMALNKNAKREEGKPLPFLADDERIKVLNYLFENKEKIFFQPEEMLFYAIYAKDTVIVEELRRLGVKLSKMRIHIITDGGKDMNEYWNEYSAMMRKLTDEDYIEIMQQLALELDGKPFYFTEKMFDTVKEHLCDVKIFEFFLTHFDQKKMKKYQIIRSVIDKDAVEVLSVIEREGWLATPKKRDEMIEYASEKGRTESLAWLLDFKNRTADFDAEQKMAEKKLMRELNTSPDSIFALKKIWSYRKREDGTLIITNYKGKNVEVTVPEKIGKNIVTAIGDGVFAGIIGYFPARVTFDSRVTVEQRKHHSIITKITLPKTLQYISKGAFCKMEALEEINIPEGIEEIDIAAFSECSSLKSITIPKKVKKIGGWAFCGCSSLQNITISKGVEEIGEDAFCGCSSLQNITIPEGVEVIGKGAFNECSFLQDVTIPEGVKKIGRNAFSGCNSLKNITIPKGVKEIGNWAFSSCSSLKNITISRGVEKIGKGAFSNCSSLKNITISKGVEEIGEGAFNECSSLQDITIPEGVKKIGDKAFAYCENLERIYICEGVFEIGERAFMHCSNLTEIRVPKSVQHLITTTHKSNEEYGVFSDCPKLIVYCPEGCETETYCKEKGIPFKNI